MIDASDANRATPAQAADIKAGIAWNDGGRNDGGRTEGLVREAVAIFDSREALQKAIDDLSLSGFERHELSVLANDETIRDRLGYVPGNVGDIAHNPDAPRQSYVSPEDTGSMQGVAAGFPAYVGAIIATGAVLATGGTALAAVAAAAVAGAGGGAAGSFLSQWLTDKRNEPMLQHLDKGGILLWVATGTPERERVAVEMLNRHAIKPAEVHEVRQTGSM